MQVLESAVSRPRSESEETEPLIQIHPTDGYIVNWRALHAHHVARAASALTDPRRAAWHRAQARIIKAKHLPDPIRPWTWAAHCAAARGETEDSCKY